MYMHNHRSCVLKIQTTLDRIVSKIINRTFPNWSVYYYKTPNSPRVCCVGDGSIRYDRVPRWIAEVQPRVRIMEAHTVITVDRAFIPSLPRQREA